MRLIRRVVVFDFNHDLLAGLQVQVEGVGEHHLGPGFGQLGGADALHRGQGAHRHEAGGVHRAVRGVEAAAAGAGAAAAGVSPEPWRELGKSIGEAYQVADDIQDAIADTATIGKPTGIDVALDRPSAVRELGLQGAVKRLERCIEKGLDSIPACKGRALLHDVVQQQSNRFFPQGIKHTAA